MCRVADVLGERDSSVAIIYRERIVHFGTERKDGCGISGIDRDRTRDETAAPADEQWCFIDDLEYGVVGRLDDSSIVVEDERDELLGSFGGEWGMREIGRRTDERLREMFEKKDMERGRGEHDADCIELTRVWRSGVFACENDGTLR